MTKKRFACDIKVIKSDQNGKDEKKFMITEL